MRYQVSLVMAAIAAAVLLGSALSGAAVSSLAATAPAPAPAAPVAAQPAGLPDFKAIIKRNQASVVNISTSQQVQADAPTRGLPPGAGPGLPPGQEELVFEKF
jgi:S1-C subfamily serine protease